MIDVGVSEPARPPGRWRRWSALVAAVVLLVAGAALLSGGTAEPASSAETTPASLGGPPVAVPPVGLRTPEAHTVPMSGSLVQLPGAPPARGRGTFEYAAGRGPVLGRKGAVLRFHVAVEGGSGEDVDAFAARVEATLGNPRSWVGSRKLRLLRVGPEERAAFTVFLATRETAAPMCARGGTNIRVRRVPYTSCRTTGRVIINLDRWRRSAPPYVAAHVPLRIYRAYVINHEVGHQLGHHHEGCPKRGGPAPVMVQQTLTLRGCTPNAWPRGGNHELAGPGV